MKMTSLEEGSDLLEALVSCVKEKNYTSCWIFGIGALKNAKLAWYNQEKMKYEEVIKQFNEYPDLDCRTRLRVLKNMRELWRIDDAGSVR